MANIKISELPEANSVQNDDLLMIIQEATNKKVTKEILLQEVNSDISDIQSEQITQNADIQENETKIQELEQEIQNLKEASYKISETGTDITLNNTSNNKFLQLDVKGNTEQTTLTGKNKINVADITITGNGSDQYVFRNEAIDNTKNYVLSIDYKYNNPTFSSTGALIILVQDGTYTTLARTDSSSSGKITTQINNKSQISVYVGGRLTGGSVDLSNFMLEEGTTATDFEPYCGGIPSPNPQFPQPIYNVTGDVNVKIQNKNLAAEMEQGSISSTTGNPGISTTRIRTIDFIKTFFNNFTLSCKNNTNYKCIVFEYDKNKNFIQRVSEWTSLPFSFVITNKTKYIKYIIAKNNDSDILPIEVEEIQLEQGTTPTTYIEHEEQNLPFTLGTIELNKLDTAQDYFYKENNKWYLHKEIEKIILNGTETWYGATYGNCYRCYTSIEGAKTYPNLSSAVALSNYFNKTINVFVSDAIKEGMFGQYSNTTNFYFATNETSLDNFKTWLSTHNTEVYYVLAIPTNTEITDTTLIEQLNAIKEAMSYYEQTNISSTSNEVSVKIDATAIGDLNLVIS